MITRAEHELSEQEVESVLEGPVLDWFKSKYPSFTPPQKYAISLINSGKNVLISSPTGSGKTLSAFLSILNHLIKIGRMGGLEDRVYAVYVSPLKALNNDISRNLSEPLSEIRAMHAAKGGEIPEIRVGVRTGDTLQSERTRMLKKPPHILITTPESLAIMLCAPKFSTKLAGAEYIIVDEIHALAENKRGAHLSLSLERLEEMCGRPLVRIGLSATVHPLEEVAKFLVGTDRDCTVVDVNYLRKTSIEIRCPLGDLVYDPMEKANTEIYSALDQIISENRTTLVFTNTRSATERVVFHLQSRFGEKYVENIAAHHSSLSREHRLGVEERLKRGELKAVVSSTSLELGIDIGTIDAVVLLSSPKSVSRALQRIGRSGHRLRDISRGIIIAIDRDDLIEDIVLAHGARERRFDTIRIYKNALDVLCQHILGMSLQRNWKFKEALDLVRKSYPYSELTEPAFDSVLKYLSGYYSELESRFVYGRIWYDGAEIGKRGRATRAIYSMNMGTIPDEPKIRVMEGTKYIGEIEEGFLEKLAIGDVFVLGGKSYEFQGCSINTARVVPAPSRSPTVPAWYSESLPLSYELALAIERFRRLASEMDADKLSSAFGITPEVARAALVYISEQARLSIIPDEKTFLVEEWKDDEGRMNYVFHCLCGRKANEAIARAFAYAAGQKKHASIAACISDYGFSLKMPLGKALTRLEIEELIWMEDIGAAVSSAINGTEIIKRRFRHVAGRSYLILRRFPGRNVNYGRQQFNSEVLLTLIQEAMPDFPMLGETFREILEDAMHVDEARKYLDKIRARKMEIRSDPNPSPFALGILSMGATDVVMADGRREFIRKMHARLMSPTGRDGNTGWLRQ